MPFKFQKVSDYGTSTPVVARTLPQAGQLMEALALPKELKDAVSKAEFELQRQLIRCHGEKERVSSGVQSALDALKEKGLDVQSGGQAFGVPAVPDLEIRAQSFTGD